MKDKAIHTYMYNKETYLHTYMYNKETYHMAKDVSNKDPNKFSKK